jgi:hypothetical protein
MSCGICGLRFPLPIIPPIAPHSSSSIIIRDWYNRPVVASVIVDPIPLHPKKGEFIIRMARPRRVRWAGM